MSDTYREIVKQLSDRTVDAQKPIKVPTTRVSSDSRFRFSKLEVSLRIDVG